MESFFTSLKNLKAFKVRITYSISVWLVILMIGVVPPSFADETTKQTKAILPNSVAVLPFENVSPNRDDAYFAVGFHKEILNNLAKIRDITVIPGISVVRYIDTNKPNTEIASELNVATIMQGSVRYANNRVTLAVQLIDASNNKQLWSNIYERDLYY